MLKETANILKSSDREADLVIHFWGEEILVVLLNMELDIANRWRKRSGAKWKSSNGGWVTRGFLIRAVIQFP